jgi:hypothetical protein
MNEVFNGLSRIGIDYGQKIAPGPGTFWHRKTKSQPCSERIISNRNIQMDSAG